MTLSTALRNLIVKTLLHIVLIAIALGLIRAIQLRWELFPNIEERIIVLVCLCPAFLICFLVRHELKWFRHLNKRDKRLLSKNNIFKLVNEIDGGGDWRMWMRLLIFIMSFATFVMTALMNLEDSLERSCNLLLYIAIVLAVGSILLLLSGWMAGIMNEKAMLKEQKEDAASREFILKIITFQFRIIYKKIKGEKAPDTNKRK